MPLEASEGLPLGYGQRAWPCPKLEQEHLLPGQREEGRSGRPGELPLVSKVGAHFPINGNHGVSSCQQLQDSMDEPARKTRLDEHLFEERPADSVIGFSKSSLRRIATDPLDFSS
jgi:hypothetical protein